MKELKEKLGAFKLSASQREELLREYARGCAETLSAEDFTRYFQTGERLSYENKYFAKRGALNAAFMLWHDDAAYTDALCDMLIGICDEFSWALPAHTDISRGLDAARITLDLFAAETAQTLAEIKHLMGEALLPELGERISLEIERRVIQPFLSSDPEWMRARSNWAAVCGGCVGMTLIYERPELMKTQARRIEAAMNCYLDGFGNDGACTEGLDYWTYGFGYFVYFAQMYREFTGRDLLGSEKVRNIALFQQNMYLSGNAAVSFSDSARTASFQSGLTNYLCAYFKGEVFSPPEKYARKRPECNRFAHFLRSFLWTDGDSDTAERGDGSIFYPDAQWYINKKKGFSVAVKGGNNGESHNHNDIGAFIFASDGIQNIADIGAGEYTRDYFGENRYKYFCTSSLGHSVPIIDGRSQSAGEEYGARVIFADSDDFCLDISGAYGIDGLAGLEREFKFFGGSVALEDSFKFTDGAAHNIIERFISVIPPQITNGGVRLGGARLRGEGKPVITGKSVRAHDGRAELVYIIDFTVKNNRFKLKIEI